MMHRRDFLADSARAVALLAGAGLGVTTLGACKRKPESPQPSGTAAALPQSSAQPTGDLRIAAVSPALAITLRDLGLADKIIARHAWDMVLDLKVPIVGDQANLDYEALLDARPTHVLLEWGVRPVPERMTSLAAEHNWRVKSWSLLSYDQLRASFNEIATFIAQGQPAKEGLALAARAAELTTRFDNACAQRPAASRAGTVLLLHSISPLAALGPGSFHHDILSRLGGRPALTSGNAYIQMHMEDLVRTAPESIVIVEPRDPRGAARANPGPIGLDPTDWPAIETKLGAIARLNIPAVKNRRVAIIDDPFALTPSSAMIGFAEDLAGILDRWAAGRQG